MLLTDDDRMKAVKNGFRQDLIDTWNGEPYVCGLKLFTAPKGRLVIERFKTQERLAGKLNYYASHHNLSSHCLLVLKNAGFELSPQQTQRAEVREKKNSSRSRNRK